MPKEAESTLGDLANQLEALPEKVAGARDAVKSLQENLESMVKSNPMRTVLGAFALGWILAKVGRYL